MKRVGGGEREGISTDVVVAQHNSFGFASGSRLRQVGRERGGTVTVREVKTEVWTYSVDDGAAFVGSQHVRPLLQDLFTHSSPQLKKVSPLQVEREMKHRVETFRERKVSQSNGK